jgi:hypothetical protein
MTDDQTDRASELLRQISIGSTLSAAAHAHAVKIFAHEGPVFLREAIAEIRTWEPFKAATRKVIADLQADHAVMRVALGESELRADRLATRNAEIEAELQALRARAAALDLDLSSSRMTGQGLGIEVDRLKAERARDRLAVRAEMQREAEREVASEVHKEERAAAVNAQRGKDGGQ